MAATVLNLPFGSLYAFSVFLKPLEALLGVSRGDLALVFALASAGFGTGMLLAPRLFGRAPTALLVLACTLAGTSGAVVAATAGGLFQLALGYGVLFGAGGGAGYILAQQTVNLAVTRRQGLVNGYVVGLYPAGAMIAAPLFGWSIRAIGVRATLGGFAAVLAVTGVIAAWLIAHSGVALGAASTTIVPDEAERRRSVFWRLWIVFFLAASAGLMVLSQAAGIITAYGGGTALAVYGTTFIAATIAVARLGGGWMVDWLTIPVVAAGAHAVALAGNVALTLWPGPGVSVLALALVGLGYGVISGLTAAAVAVYWRRALYGRMASRIYIAWCAAAIILPITAGYLFDLTRGYGSAILIAAGGNALGIVQVGPDSSGAVPGPACYDLGGAKPTEVKSNPCIGSRLQIDPGRFLVRSKTVHSLIVLAYGKDCDLFTFDLLSGGPSWIRSERFDIEALIPEGTPAYTSRQFIKGDAPKLQEMLKNLLEDRFKLVMHRDMKEMPGYFLTIKGKAKLTASKEGDPPRDGLTHPPEDPTMHLVGGKATMTDLALWLGRLTGRPVLDRTGITGEFNYDVKYVPVDNQPGAGTIGLVGPSIFTAIQEELGLKLESTRVPLEILVIDRVEKPSEN